MKFHPMSAASMTMTASPQQVIDLTLDDPVATAIALETSQSHVPGTNKQPYLNVVSEEPPSKKRRIGGGGAQERETAKAFVQQLLLPHVARAVDQLSPQQYAVDRIAVEVCNM